MTGWTGLEAKKYAWTRVLERRKTCLTTTARTLTEWNDLNTFPRPNTPPFCRLARMPSFPSFFPRKFSRYKSRADNTVLLVRCLLTFFKRYCQKWSQTTQFSFFKMRPQPKIFHPSIADVRVYTCWCFLKKKVLTTPGESWVRVDFSWNYNAKLLQLRLEWSDKMSLHSPELKWPD